MFRSILNRFRELARKILGVPPLVIYRSDFPSGKLIGRPSEVGAFTIIDYGGCVRIGRNVKIGFGVIILSVSSISGRRGIEVIKKPVIIGDNVEIGSNVVILPGVKIGDNSTVGAGAVVTENIPPNSIAVGIPAKVLETRVRKAEEK